VTKTLDALGSPESLAQTYRAEGLLNRAAAGFSPWLLLRATFSWAMAGIEGFFALLAIFTGYATALSFLACAVLRRLAARCEAIRSVGAGASHRSVLRFSA